MRWMTQRKTEELDLGILKNGSPDGRDEGREATCAVVRLPVLRVREPMIGALPLQYSLGVESHRRGSPHPDSQRTGPYV